MITLSYRSLLTACLAAMVLQGQEVKDFVLLASTIGPIDSRIVDALETAFEEESGIRVRHVGAGTGAALDMARRGGVDLVLVHARTLEEAFVREGFGTRRIPLMYNDLVIVGPPADPAGIRGMKTAVETLRTLAGKSAPFLSREDKSGTHMAELELWDMAGIKPTGSWYTVFEKGSEGNVATLMAADARQAYTVVDRASYLGVKPRVKLAVLVEGDEALLNHNSLIPVNRSNFPHTNATAANAFVTWLCDPLKGRRLIAEFGRTQYGQPLFVPEYVQ